jgi:hypothetical protein
MSRLAKDEDDHPEAALKHLGDARALRRAERLDGTAYHSGYVVECALKAVLLHDRSFDAATRTTNPEQLATWHRNLRRWPFGHNLVALVNAALGEEGARYLPPFTNESVLGWSEQMRYHPEGKVDAFKADAYLAGAELAARAIVQMTLDGVL